MELYTIKLLIKIKVLIKYYNIIYRH